MKRVLAILLSVLLMFSFSSAFAAQAGDTVEVTFKFTSGGAYAFDLVDLTYPDELTFVKAEPSVGFAGAKGWSYASLSPVTSATCTYTFKIAADAAEGVYPVTMTLEGAYDSSYAPISASISQEKIIVGEHVHTEEIVPAVAPSCTESGLTEGKVCTTCGDIIVAQEVVAALGHTEAVLEAVAATCTEPGLTEGKVCEVCDEIILAQETVEALGHTEAVLEAVAATCTEPGLTEGKVCEVCDEILVAQEVVEAAHDWVEVPAKEPTYTEPGYTAGKVCSVCQATEGMEEIGVLVPTKAPEYSVEKISDARGKVTYLENEGSKPLDEVYVKITWRYVLANGDTISVTLSREVREDGTFKLTGVSVPDDYSLDFIYVEVTDDIDADEKDFDYDVFGWGEW